MNKWISIAGVLLGSTAVWAQPTPTWEESGVMSGFPPKEEARVNVSNWIAPPYNRWAFQNVRSVLPTNALQQSSAPVALEQGEPLNILDMAAITEEGKKTTVSHILAKHNTDAFLVTYKGKVVAEHYWNGMTPETPHWLASVSKSFVGLLAEILIDEGKLNREEVAQAYVPELKGTALGSATVGQLLDMTAGTQWDESMEALMDAKSPARQYGLATGTMGVSKDSSGVFSFLPTVEQSRPHGEAFLYNAPQNDVLGWVLSAATNTRLEDLISEYIWSHIGAEHPAYYVADSASYSWATGGLAMTARDLVKFGHLINHNGKFNGKEVFSSSVMKPILEGNTELFRQNGSYNDRMPGAAYSSSFWLLNNEDGALMGKGVFSQYVYMNPAKDVVIVRLASPETSSKPAFDLEMLPIFQAISDELTRS